MIKNVTISMDENLAQLTRVQAAKAGKSMSRFIADLLDERFGESGKREKRNLQLEAMERFLSGRKWDLTESGRMPTAEERNARR